MALKLVIFEPGMEGKFIPYEALEEGLHPEMVAAVQQQLVEKQSSPGQGDLDNLSPC